MGIKCLPNEILVAIITSHLPSIVSVYKYVQLRLVNRKFNDIVLYAFFDLNVVVDHYADKIREIQRYELCVFRYWRAFLQPHNIRLRQQIHEQKEHTLQNNLPDTLVYERKVLSALRCALPQIMSRLVSLDQLCYQPTTFKEKFSDADLCIYAMCQAAVYLHGSSHAWNLLTEFVERDYSNERKEIERAFTPAHDVETWRLYAAVYMNDIQELKAILKPLQVRPVDLTIWRKRLSAEYSWFIDARSHAYGAPPVQHYQKATYEEQRWIKMSSSALIIAASLGHVDIATYLMELEPNLFRNAPRTQLYRTSWRSAMGQAIAFEQRQVFKVLLKHKWPLVTKTGFARNNYFNALRIALEVVPNSVEPDSILQSLFDMSDAWKCSYILKNILRIAAQRNNIELGTIVFNETSKKHHGLVAYHWTSGESPYFSLVPGRHEFVLDVAAYYGSLEFVRFLVHHAPASEEIGSTAKDSAIHTIICLVTNVKDSHITILKELVELTEKSYLEVALLHTILRPGTRLMNILIPKVDLSNKIGSERTMHRGYSCYTGHWKSAAILPKPVEEATIGEFGLAMALKTLEWDKARILIEKYDVVLRHYFIKTGSAEMVHSMSDFTALKDILAQSSMSITLERARVKTNDHETSTSDLVTFNPAPYAGVEPVEFASGYSFNYPEFGLEV